ncbi:hypothetical protein M8818_004761 [Zalaria obscura]|uniref:Uncharacterized protein n=1 Tax=Zalaria obscura TaxID=2024903 RepID=A0ACC3SCT8_9PEZI
MRQCTRHSSARLLSSFCSPRTTSAEAIFVPVLYSTRTIRNGGKLQAEFSRERSLQDRADADRNARGDQSNKTFKPFVTPTEVPADRSAREDRSHQAFKSFVPPGDAPAESGIGKSDEQYFQRVKIDVGPSSYDRKPQRTQYKEHPRPARGGGRFSRDDDEFEFEGVPFEFPKGSPGPELPAGPTMTAEERKTFEQLGRLAKKGPPSRGRPRQPEPSQTAKQTPDGDDATFDLDKVLTDALTAAKGPKKQRPFFSTEQPTESERSQIPVSTGPWIAERKQDKAETKKLRQADRAAEFRRIMKLVHAANTDLEVWKVLEEEVFSVIAATHLDDPALSAQEKAARDAGLDQATLQSRQIIPHIFPTLLGTISKHLRTEYPTSTLPLSFIPKLRAMGPLVYALGASTRLYNETMAAHFEGYTNLDAVDSLLTEMEREVIIPDFETLELLRSIMTARRLVRDGYYGPAVQSLWGTRRMNKNLWMISLTRNRLKEGIMAASEGQQERRKPRLSSPRSVTLGGPGSEMEEARDTTDFVAGMQHERRGAGLASRQSAMSAGI